MQPEKMLEFLSAVGNLKVIRAIVIPHPAAVRVWPTTAGGWP